MQKHKLHTLRDALIDIRVLRNIIDNKLDPDVNYDKYTHINCAIYNAIYSLYEDNLFLRRQLSKHIKNTSRNKTIFN
jgi:hypothetical protein